MAILGDYQCVKRCQGVELACLLEQKRHLFFAFCAVAAKLQTILCAEALHLPVFVVGIAVTADY